MMRESGGTGTLVTGGVIPSSEAPVQGGAGAASASSTDAAPHRATLDAAGVLRALKDLIRAELRRRGGAEYTDAQSAAWGEATVVGSRALEVDSIEFISIAGRVNEMFHLHEAGAEHALLEDRTLGAWARVCADAAERARGAAAVTVLTSGSTGAPKAVTHPLALLGQEVDALARMFAGRTRVVSLVPANHLYGVLFTVLLPARLGVPVLDARGAGPAALGSLVREGDLVVGFPLAWEGVLLGAGGAGASPLRGAWGVNSTGPLASAAWAALRGRGLAEMIEVYGSTESGGVGVRRGPEEAYELHEFWSRAEGEERSRSRGGVGGDEIESVGALVRALPRGWEDAGAAAGAPGVLRFEPMDRLEFVGERRFVVRGRRDGAVKVGGINVFPARVAEVIAQHPGVAACGVRPMRPDEGERLKAFVVPREAGADREALRAELEDWCRAMLSTPERPRRWAFGAELPRGAMGKAGDW